MANLNKVMLMGNLTRDPVLKYLPSGTAVCEIGLASNRIWYDQQTKEKKEEVTYIDCSAFGRQAENISKFFKKGRPIFVEGRLHYRAWEKDGVKRNKLDVVIEAFEFIGGRQDGDGPPGRQAQGSQSEGGSQQGSSGNDSGGGAPHFDDEVPF